ncbi:MAG: DUF3322 domain-containing protein [Actinomycetales bacterium]
MSTSTRTRPKGWSGTGWTSAPDIREALRRRWNDGSLLRTLASGEEFAGLSVPLTGPKAQDLAERLPEAQAWVAQLRAGAQPRGRPRGARPDPDGSAEAGTTQGPPGAITTGPRVTDEGLYDVEWRTVGGGLLGSNELPRRVHVRTLANLWQLLGVEQEVADFQAQLAAARQVDPAIASWVLDHPHKALALREEWGRLLRCVAWIRDHTGSGLYLRQLDIHGVDTKFIERHRVELAALIDLVLPEERIDRSRTTREFDARYGFRTRPEFVRTRMLDGTCWVADGVSDTYLRIDEAAQRRPPADEVIIVENEISYLALPPMPGVLGIFGKGFDVARLAGLDWLKQLRVRYWGDIDTHGFVILDRLRAHVPQAESILMDLDTLIRHRDLCGTEPTPARGRVGRLTGPELAAYDYLTENLVDGRPLRLEQERIPYPQVCAAVEP